MNDKDYMGLALHLAKATIGQTTPNPSVGAVIVNNGQIVGLGSHLFAGSFHAEIYAINMAGEKAKGATLYVTLEPCVHFGRTPPCTDAIIAAGIDTVVIATLDLNPEVAGRGVKALIVAGINVEVGLLEDEAKQINQVFFYFIQNKLPYVSIKAGMSLDGKLSTTHGESQWITNSKSRADAHYYRHTHDAILVGIGTVLADNPRLTTRLPEGGKNPIRIILDTSLRTPENALVITDSSSPTWIVTGNLVNTDEENKFANFPHVKIINLPSPTINLQLLLMVLAENGVTSILVEGGNRVISGFLDAKIANQVILYISPILLGGLEAPTFFAGEGFAHLSDGLNLAFDKIEHIDDNIKIIAKIRS